MWIIEERQNEVIVHNVSTIFGIEQFILLKNSGFLDTDEKLRHDKTSCDALFKLIHISPSKLDLWYKTWDSNFVQNKKN